jgi:hypothetical protein
MYSLNFIKKNPKKSLLIFLLDIGFYLMIFIILSSFLELMSREALALSPLMEKMSGVLENSTDLMNQLIMIFFRMILWIFLLVLCMMISQSVLKGIIWIITENKKILFSFLMRYFYMTLLISAIFFIPIVLSFIPIVSEANNYGQTQMLNMNIMTFLPLIILSILFIYFTTISYCFLSKEEKFKASFKKTFIHGFKRFHILILPFIILFTISSVSLKLMSNYNIASSFIGLIIFLLIIIIISLFNRDYLARNC